MSLDRPCYRHPDRPAEAYCQKFDRYLCAECITCSEPKSHCKFRPMCMIWEWQKHGLPTELQSKLPSEPRRDAEATDEEDGVAAKSG